MNKNQPCGNGSQIHTKKPPLRLRQDSLKQLEKPKIQTGNVNLSQRNKPT